MECLRRINTDIVMKGPQDKMDLHDHFIDLKKRNGKWVIGKWYGDTVIYSKCPVCGFSHETYRNAYHEDEKQFCLEYNEEKEYNFCPICGTKMLDDNEMFIPVDLIKNILGQINMTKCLYICRDEDGTLLAFSKLPIKGYDGKWKVQVNPTLKTNKNYGGVEIPKHTHLFDDISLGEIKEIDISFIIDDK